MNVQLFGNIDNKTYQAPQINLMQKIQEKGTTPLTFKETIKGLNDASVSVSISDEGFKALHGSKLQGAMDPMETAKQIEYMSNHQPIESFSNRLAQMMPSNYEMNDQGEAVFVSHTYKEKEEALILGFKQLYNEISIGHNLGTRVRYIEDETAPDGFRQLTKDEELEILKQEFDDFVDSRFGAEAQAQNEKVTRETRAYAERHAGAKITQFLEVTDEQKAERASKEELFQKSIVQLESPYRIKINREESCIMRSFRLDEYYSIQERMKKEDPDAYNALCQANEEADKNHDTSAKFRALASAYSWAYGDAFDKIHKVEPEVDIYIKSASTPENHDYQFTNNRKSIVLTTDELKLLQSTKSKDADAQKKLWDSIMEKIGK